MEAVILVGIQAAGKSTFYRARFFDTHVRINLDMLRTRPREDALLRACLQARQPFVVDNTNVTAAERARYVAPARLAGFRVVGYFFRPDPRGSIRRNRERAQAGGRSVPVPGVLGAAKRLEEPALEEGFDVIHEVVIDEAGNFVVRVLAGHPLPPPAPEDEKREGVEL
ncbi:MAG TPA: AAA family ATPase [Longimicrobiaceae bacterium]|nr:AAA family ATPase [Longimicrobiaceae bacterium]